MAQQSAIAFGASLLRVVPTPLVVVVIDCETPRCARGYPAVVASATLVAVQLPVGFWRDAEVRLEPCGERLL